MRALTPNRFGRKFGKSPRQKCFSKHQPAGFRSIHSPRRPTKIIQPLIVPIIFIEAAQIDIHISAAAALLPAQAG
jgi:hypothetical protein